MAANPAPTTTPALPDDVDKRRACLRRLAKPALQATALKAGVSLDGATTKDKIVEVLVRSDDAMRVQGWFDDADPAPAEPEASTGDVDADGEIVGANDAPADPYDCDDDGFPADPDDLPKLEDEHVDGLVSYIETFYQLDRPAFPGRDEKVAWIREHGYQEAPDIAAETPAPVGSAPAAPDWTPTDGVEAAPTGWPNVRDDIDRLNPDHLEYLKWAAVHQDGNDDPGALDGDTLRSWLKATYDNVPGQTTIDDVLTDDAEPHIPTAAPTPITVPAPCTRCSGKGGWQTDDGFEACTECTPKAEANANEDGNLSLFIGGDKPMGSYLNIPALRVDLLGQDIALRDGDRVRVTLEIPLDKFGVHPEKRGSKVTRRVRTITGTVDVESVDLSLA